MSSDETYEKYEKWHHVQVWVPGSCCSAGVRSATVSECEHSSCSEASECLACADVPGLLCSRGCLRAYPCPVFLFRPPLLLLCVREQNPTQHQGTDFNFLAGMQSLSGCYFENGMVSVQDSYVGHAAAAAPYVCSAHNGLQVGLPP